jgi:uncharacterized repeat protein (TIGR01451 family)
MRARRMLGALLGAAVFAGLLTAPGAPAAPTPVPVLSIQSLAAPTNFALNSKANYQVFITNNGGKTTDQSEITITDTLPAGLEVERVDLFGPRQSSQDIDKDCEVDVAGEVSTVTCKVTDALRPQTEPAKLFPTNGLFLEIRVAVPPDAAGTLVNQVEVEGGGAAAATANVENEVSAKDPPAGFAEFKAELTGPDGLPVGAAASHPYQYTTSFAVNLVPSPPGSAFPFVPAEGDLKDVEVALPPGLAANPTAVDRCSAQDFITVKAVVTPQGGDSRPNQCPPGSAVGVAIVEQLEGTGGLRKFPVYNLIPPPGMPAQLGFLVLGAPVYINTKIRSEGDYAAIGFLDQVTEAQRVTASRIFIWGTPWEESHDPVRGKCAETVELCPVVGTPRPFLRLPSSCDYPLLTTISYTTWAKPATGASASFEEPAPVGCESPPFDPEIEAKPTTNVADSPSGLHFNLHLPQKENEDPEGLGEADLKDATVTLPKGLLVNPSSADGLAACSLSEIGYQGFKEGKPSFSANPANCPDAAKVGSVQVTAPAVDHPLPGSVYLATPHENPFNSLIAIYIAVHDPQTGVVVKLAGEVTPDPVTGQLSTTVKQSPQVPFEDFDFNFFEGARAPLRTPATCGTHTTTSSLKPWSAPASGPDATPSDSFQIAQSPGGGSCPTTPGAQPNSPSFEAGTEAPVAGAYSPFVLKLARADGSQEIKGIDLTLPPGLTGKLAGLSYCPEGSLAAASAKSGKAEQSSPSCPTSSELGTVAVAAGAGPAPYHAQGKAYLAGPYKGAPISMAVITPAVAGPFDLGTVVVRAAFQIDPETARIRAVSDPLPRILQGIPLDVRSIALRVDRPDFTLNPTSCDPFAFSGQALSVLDQVASLSSHFQVGGCQDLAFKPKLSLRLKGGTKRADHPQLTATLKMPPKGANIAKAQVALPRSVFLDQANIRTICTRVQFAASACPKGAVYGYAKAWTPLLDQPLQGPVYLRSSDNLLPDLVADLNGQIHVVLHGRTDSIRGGIRNTFEGVPDAPASKFTLTLKGGKRGLLVNSRNICKGKNRATAIFTAQSGKVSEFRPVLEAKCGGKGRKGKRGR